MLKFIILCIFTYTQSATEYNFTKIYSYQYIEIDLDSSDVFYQYEEKLTKIKFEIFEPKTNKQLYTIYQYNKKTDVKFDEVTRKYINYITVRSYDNMEVFYKKGNFFVITKNEPPIRKNLNNSATIKKYISFMPENPLYKIDTFGSIKELKILNEFNNIYVDIKVDSIYNYLSVFSEGEDLLYSVNGIDECNNRECNFNIKQSKNKEIYELRIVNLDLEKNITRKSIYYLLYIKPNQTNDYYHYNFTKLFYFENINYIYTLNNSKYYEQYLDLKEGSIVYYTHPNNINSIEMFSELISLQSGPQFWYFEKNNFYYIIYFLPTIHNLNARLFEFKLKYYEENSMGDISIIAVKPTEIINYPEKYEYTQEKEKYTPLLLRIVFNNNFNDNVLLKFSSDTQCIEGTIFENNKFNTPNDCSSKKIDSSYKGKVITIIFKKDILMETIKELNFIKLSQYELKKFSFNNQIKEISFKYTMKSYSKIYINFLNPDSNYKYYIYTTENIKYNPKTKEYLNSQINGDLKKTISFKLFEKVNLIIIIQCKLDQCLYDDYITIREDNIIVDENLPKTFEEFNDLSYVVFEFIPKKYLKYKIETNTEFGGYNQSLVDQIDDNINSDECYEQSCLFQFEGINTKYLIVISSLISTQISKKMHILFNEDKYEFEMENKFNIKHYFISSFKFNFEIKNQEILNKFNEVKEGGFVLRIFQNYMTKYGIKVTYLNDEQIIPINKLFSDSPYDYYYSYINIKNKINNLIFKVSGSFNFDIPAYISFAYISPTFILNFPTNTYINNTSSTGIPSYVRLIKNNFNSQNEYIIGVEKNARFTEGYIIKDDGSDLNQFNPVYQYKLSKDYPKNIYTFRFDYAPKIVFGEINGDYYYNNESRKYQNYDFNFKKDENKFYIELYNNKQDETCAYLEGNEKNFVNIYDMAYNNNLDYLIYGKKIETNFFCLDNSYNIMKFNSTNELNTQLIIFDPRLDKERLNTNTKFYLPQKKKKSLYFEKDDINYNIFRIILKEYTKTLIKLTYSNNKEYKLNVNNNYSFTLQYNKKESENYLLQPDSNSLIFIKLLEGKIYEEITLQKNESSIVLNNNSVAFELLYGKNFTSYTIRVKNFENKFYYKIYETNETDFGKLIIPQLNPPYIFIDCNDNKTKDLIIHNPYFDGKSDNQKYIFVMSYEHDFEKESIQKFNYNLTLIYNPIDNKDYERLNESSFNIITQKNFNSNYSIGNGKDDYFLMIFSTFSDGKLDFEVLFSSNLFKKKYNLNKNYIQINEPKLYPEFIYVLSISSNKITGKYSCVEISFQYGKKNKNLEKYNNLKVVMDYKGNIIFDSINENQITYEIYITNSIDNYKNLFENDCFLLEKKKQIKNNENISEGAISLYESKDNKYKLNNVKGNYLINVVAIDNEYHMRIVYKSFVFTEPGTSGWFIFFIFLIIILIIVLIIAYRGKRNSYDIDNFNLMNKNDGTILP